MNNSIDNYIIVDSSIVPWSIGMFGKPISRLPFLCRTKSVSSLASVFKGPVQVNVDLPKSLARDRA
jgi:hypothetical protein